MAENQNYKYLDTFFFKKKRIKSTFFLRTFKEGCNFDDF